jgi:hypothetical protein
VLLKGVFKAAHEMKVPVTQLMHSTPTAILDETR